MKIIEALKQTKTLVRKIDDLKSKINENCADMANQKPTYGTEEQQSQQLKDWIQSIHDSVKEIMRLRILIQKTNLVTDVTIPIGDKTITHTIAEWIHRRRDLAGFERLSWKCLTDRGLKRAAWSPDGTQDKAEFIDVRRYYDPKERDKKIELFTEEIDSIDSKLEVVNAETELVE